MCSRYAEAQCCVCRRYLDQSSNRIIVETCGHQKCRECFIKEEDGCTLCKRNKQQFLDESGVCSAIHDPIPSSSEGAKDVLSEDGSTENLLTIDMNEDVTHIITKNEPGNAMRYKCTICQKTFKSRNNRKYHLFCDKTRSKPFQCNQCDKQFITLAHMNYHQTTHNENNHFACDHCPKVYSGEIALKKHMRKHQNILKYQCSQCDEKFLYKEQLNMHQNRHNNVFHKCPECGKRFLIKSNLTKHIQSHSGLNRKVCSICKNSFSGNSALKTHMLTHSKSKSHQCDKCAKKFIDQRTLERHWKTHTEHTFYECTLCSAKSGRKDNIRRHVRNIHSKSDEELQKILEKIFQNFEKTKNMPNSHSGTMREKTEKDDTAMSTEPQNGKEICVHESNEMIAAIERPIKSMEVVRNIATSVIKFVGRSQDVTHEEQEETNITQNEMNKFTVETSESIRIESKPQMLSILEPSASDPVAEIGVNLPSLEPLNYDPFPDIAPLPLINTNTNLTVYRQLLSPYLKKQSATASESSDTVSSQRSPNKHLKSSSTAMVCDRPPKKMIEKYEIYRN